MRVAFLVVFAVAVVGVLSTDLETVDKEFDVKGSFSFSGSVQRTKEVHVHFRVNDQDLLSKSPRVITELVDADLKSNATLQVSVRHEGNQISWKNKPRDLSSVAKILCIDRSPSAAKSRPITIVLSTLSPASEQSLSFKLRVDLTVNVLGHVPYPANASSAIAKSSQVMITPRSPFVWIYQADEDGSQTGKTLSVVAQSEESDVCGMISIQPLR